MTTNPPTTHRAAVWSRRLTRVAAGLGIAMLCTCPIVATAQAGMASTDPLGQTLDPNQAQGEGRVVLDAGHVDFGPTLNTGAFILEVHDDTQVPSVWRQLDDVVVHVNDRATLAVPDTQDYAFLGQPVGTEVWVIPQTQETGVVWMGWNTQEPLLMAGVSGGITLSVAGIQGPGDVVVFLNSGNFGPPQLLWDSSEAFPQASWIEVNTHTHANWVFSEPGVYGVKLIAETQSLSGETWRTAGILRIAVGDATDPQEAFAFVYDDSTALEQADELAAADDAPAGNSADDTAQLLAIVAVIVAVVLIGAVAVIVITGRRAKRLAFATRSSRAPGDGAQPDGVEPGRAREDGE